MQFSGFIVLAMATLLAMVSCNTIEFVTHDDIPRRIVFYSNAKCQTCTEHFTKIPDLHLNSIETTKIWGFPQGWQGMFKAIREGEPEYKNDIIQAEVTFQGDQGKTWFDISAIYAPNNNDGIHKLRPKFGGEDSGCNHFPCNNAYLFWNDDTKVRSSTQQDLFCDVGFM